MRHATAVSLALGLCALVSALACDKNTVTPPSPTMHTLWGQVTEGGFPVPQAKVQATASWGSDTKTTDSEGYYFGLLASGDVTLRAEKEGFSTQVKQLMVDQNRAVNFELQRIDTPGDRDPQGMYNLTITASPSCTMLPPEARQRTYSARIDRTRDGLLVTLQGANLYLDWLLDEGTRFAGTLNGNAVTFQIGSGGDNPYQGIVESIGNVGSLQYVGTATGTIGDRTIGATLSGSVRVYGSKVWAMDTLLAQCEAGDHRMEFVR